MGDKSMAGKQRVRRTKADIENRINDAAHDLISQRGFLDLQLTEITRKAEIEPVVFYNRYKNLEEFYGEFIKKFDYWLTESISQHAAEQNDPSEENVEKILDGLIMELLNDKIMLEVLRWEIAVDNPTTQREAIIREVQNMQVVQKYKKMFRDGESPINIAAFLSLIISGIYYLMLHKDRSSFCGLDYNDPKDLDILRTTVSQLVKLVFSTLKK